jgi:hypothetical protein
MCSVKLTVKRNKKRVLSLLIGFRLEAILMKKQPRQADAKLARQIHDNWDGLRGIVAGGDAHLRARAIRNAVCQVVNRSSFSAGVSGDQKDFARGMLCGVLDKLMEQTQAPKGGLAHLMDVHTTRMTRILAGKQWPKKCARLRETLLNATYWMFLGRDWREALGQFPLLDRRSWTLHRDFPHLRPHADDWDRFWMLRYAEDIADYFFTGPPGAAEFEQPYFSSVRKSWDAPYDRTELAQVVRWTRRQAKAEGRRAVIAFFVPQFDTAEALFDRQMLMPRTAFAARERPNLVRARVYYPKGAEAEAGKARLAELRSRFNRAADAEEDLRWGWRGVDPASERGERPTPHDANVNWVDCGGTEQLPSPGLRGVLAFLFLAYYQDQGSVSVRKEHLHILRPFSDSEVTPFAIETTVVERHQFVEAAARRFKEFQETLNWFRTPMPREQAASETSLGTFGTR